MFKFRGLNIHVFMLNFEVFYFCNAYRFNSKRIFNNTQLFSLRYIKVCFLNDQNEYV